MFIRASLATGVSSLLIALSMSTVLAARGPEGSPAPHPSQGALAEATGPVRADDSSKSVGAAGKPVKAAKPDKADKSAKADKITLERLFPEKSFFGPSANRADFSFDGRYGAFLWRPWFERRHGDDLWIHDFTTGETRRVTMVSVMSRFQEDTRKVRDDRVKKEKERAKKEGAGKRVGRKPAAKSAEKTDEKVDDTQVEGETKTQSERAGAVASADPVSGTWRGRVTGEGADFLPPAGVEVTIELRRAEDNSVSGVLRSSVFEAPISEGRFDPASGTLSFTLRIESLSTVARAEISLSGEKASGTIAIEGVEVVLKVEGSREAADPGPSAVAEAPPKPDAERLAEIVRRTARDMSDLVDDKDALDEKAPRYGGIQSLEWSPVANELLFMSAGEIYRCVVSPDSAQDAITRLTRSRVDERDVQWLPDGRGFTFIREGDLLRIVFGSDAIEQINPRLPDGESMTGYRLSQDGNRLVFIATKGRRGQSREVNIVSYRDRFAQVRAVPRTVSDDPVGETEQSVYLYDVGDKLAERGLLKKVFTRKQSGPRDIMRTPRWSPDSTRVAFSVFEQASGRVEIMEAMFAPVPPAPEAPKSDAKGEEGGQADSAAEGDAKKEDAETTDSTETETVKSETTDGDGAAAKKADGDGTSEGKGEAETPKALPEPPPDPKPEFEIRDARAVYRFLHNGGPNTPGLIDPHYLADSRRMVFLTELSGFRQLHILDPLYEQLEQITSGRFEVYPISISRDHRRLFVLATKDDPAQQHVYRIDLETREFAKLSRREGTHSMAAVSDDGTRVLTSVVDFGSLNELFAIDVATGSERSLTDSHPDEARALTKVAPEYFTYQNRHGQSIHGHLFRPADWTPSDKRPLLVYVYGGPLGSRKMATRGAFDAPSYFFAWYMAKVHGYVTCTIDPRGASGYGGLFEKSNYEQVGKPQVEDLVDGVKWFIDGQGVDPKRVGIHGWSFGGFQTQMCMYTEPEVFALGIAGAGPTEWENYNAWYSTGTIGPSRPGQTDLAKFSLLPLAKNLKGRLLLVHGVEDDNVLYQDTMRVYRELLKAGKEALVDLFIDPTGGHGLGGDVKTVNRYRKYEDYLVTHLGKGEPAKEQAGPPASGAEMPAEAPAEAAPPPAAPPEGAPPVATTTDAP